jgi:hypothetical protein
MTNDQPGPIPLPHSAQMLEILERIVKLNEQVVKQNQLIVNVLTLPQMLVKRSDYDRSNP